MRRWRNDPEALRDAAVLLPLAAAVLLLPPVILIFAVPIQLGGIPLIVAYVFGAWATIILSAWLIARAQLRATESGAASQGSADGGPDRR